MAELTAFLFLGVVAVTFWIMGKAVVDSQRTMVERTEAVKRIATALEKIAINSEPKKK